MLIGHRLLSHACRGAENWTQMYPWIEANRVAMGLMVDKTFRIAGYLSVILIGVLSLVPGTFRPDTGAPGKFEHLVAYLGAAMLLTLRPDTLRVRWQALWLVPYAGALELAQLLIPGRHARFSDFVVSSIGAVLGMIAAFGTMATLSKWFEKPSVPDRESL